MSTATPLKPTPVYATRPSTAYAVIMAAFVGFLLISNVAATKPITVLEGVPWLGVLTTDGGAVLFPLTYVLGDVLAEVYGMKRTRVAIWAGFALAALASLTFWVVGLLPAAPGWPGNEAFSSILGFVPRIVLASLLGYLAGQYANAWVLGAMKARWAGRPGGLWQRLVGSTLVGELVDTTVFGLIAATAWFDAKGVAVFILVGYVWKVLVEVLCLPLTYRVIAQVKRIEGLA